MKLKRFALVLACLLCFCVLALVACGTNDANWTYQTAYAKAQEYGYSGTYDEFTSAIVNSYGEEGIQDISLNARGELVITLTNSKEVNFGSIWTYQTAYAKAQEYGYRGTYDEFTDAIVNSYCEENIIGVAVNAQGELVVLLTSNKAVHFGYIWTYQTAYAKAQEYGYSGTFDEFTATIVNSYGEEDIQDVAVNAQGELVVTLTNGKAVNFGDVGGEIITQGTYYTVRFVDYDNTVLSKDVVKEGCPATPPNIPKRKGYEFTSWDRPFDCVMSDLVVMAKYTVSISGNDDDQGTTYRYSYSITVEDDAFVLYVFKSGSDGSFSATAKSGTIRYIDAYDIYCLDYSDEGETDEYIKISERGFEFCHADGSRFENAISIERRTEALIDITPRKGNSVYGYYDLTNEENGGNMQKLYYRMYQDAEAFAENKSDLNGSLCIASYRIHDFSLTWDQAIAVWKIFYSENPSYYWLSNTLEMNGDRLDLCIDNAYKLGSDRMLCDNAIQSMSEEFDALITDSMSELDIALAAHDFIVKRIDYAYKEDGVTPQDAIWAHNMIGTAMMDYGVCESYAKTFMYLCLSHGVDCLVVSGRGGNESHMWNLVRMDGIWYGVDVTWDETNTDHMSYSCFGMSGGSLNRAHFADSPESTGVNYQYALPSVSKDNVQLTYLYKGEQYIDTFMNIDKAFLAMTDASATYTLELESYAISGPLLLSAQSVEHYIEAPETPHVSKIIIASQHVDLGNGYFFTPSLMIRNDLVVNCDVDIVDCSIRAKEINMKNHQLRFEGKYPIVQLDTVHGEEGSGIVTDCSEDIDFYGCIDVDTFHFNNQRTTIRGPEFHANNYIVEENAACWFYGSTVRTVTIGNAYCYSTSFISCNRCETVDITVGNVYGINDRGVASIIIQGLTEDLPAISITGKVYDCKLSYQFLGTSVTSVTDVSGEEVTRYAENSQLPINSVLINGVNLDYSDFALISSQEDLYNEDATVMLGHVWHRSIDLTKVLRKEENGDFVFVGWDDMIADP